MERREGNASWSSERSQTRSARRVSFSSAMRSASDIGGQAFEAMVVVFGGVGGGGDRVTGSRIEAWFVNASTEKGVSSHRHHT